MAKLTAKKPTNTSAHISSGKIEAMVELTKENTKKLNVNIPDSLHYAFKKKCIEEKINMSDLVKKWIQSYLSE
ncbi:plasmid partition protein ParG [Facilibium subflavum]|uniref:plasmid partition protein ParG n=1 Tax=Facilibium subflavum TaxID=2219058 RepID=UPI000E650D5E|nr:plasmid partition protein ParG [Facilibium subflavum]